MGFVMSTNPNPEPLEDPVATILVWLPRDHNATDDDFKHGGVDDKAHQWASFDEALKHSIEVMLHHINQGEDLVPWIKRGNARLSPAELRDLYLIRIGPIGRGR